MKYQHLVSYVANTLWAILPAKMAELLQVLAFRAAGHEFTAEEIAARIGDGRAAPIQPGGAAAVIPIRGLIAHRMSGMEQSSGGASAEQISRQIAAVAADPTIGTIIYDIDSPGGTVPGIQELAAQMFALRGKKTQVAQVNSMAASAAYWLASQADEIVSLPSGQAGYIGVFTVHQDLSQALANEGIDVTMISAGKYKLEGNPFEPLSDEARAMLQTRVNSAYDQFVSDVARGRGVSVSSVRKGYGEGRALPATEALAAKMIDRIATMEDTIGRIMGRTPAGQLQAAAMP